MDRNDYNDAVEILMANSLSREVAEKIMADFDEKGWLLGKRLFLKAMEAEKDVEVRT